MKLLFALSLLTLQLKLFLVTGTSYAKGEKFVKYSQNEDQLDKRAAHKDLLSGVSCKYIKMNGYCKDFVKKTLCKTSCACTNKLSTKSCITVKSSVNCKTPWSIRFCRYTCKQCSRTSCANTFPLGMENKAIPDSSITASSMWDRNHRPARARLGMKQVGDRRGGWSTLYNSVSQWFQVDLGEVTKITGIATQGRQDSYYNQWVTRYSLQYSTIGRRFANYQKGKVFKGNSDQNTVVKYALKPPIVARFIRIRPKTWHVHISMRIELYGCV